MAQTNAETIKIECWLFILLDIFFCNKPLQTRLSCFLYPVLFWSKGCSLLQFIKLEHYRIPHIIKHLLFFIYRTLFYNYMKSNEKKIVKRSKPANIKRFYTNSPLLIDKVKLKKNILLKLDCQ